MQVKVKVQVKAVNPRKVGRELTQIRSTPGVLTKRILVLIELWRCDVLIAQKLRAEKQLALAAQ